MRRPSRHPTSRAAPPSSVGRAARWKHGALACSLALLGGCRDRQQDAPTTSAPSIASSAVLAAPSVYGSVDVAGPQATSGKPEHHDIAGAYAYFLEQWPVVDEVEPLLRLARIDLLLDPSLDHGCEREPTTPSQAAGGGLTRLTLLGEGRQTLRWEEDIAIGDDLRLCLHGRGDGGDCDESSLPRGAVILSIGRERVRGLVRVDGPDTKVHGHFVADVCH